MPVLHAPFRGRANLRNHRKLVVVDGRIALTGGMNLAWPYIGPPGAEDLWRDLSMIVEGPAVAELEALFASDWRFATGADPGGAGRPGPVPEARPAMESSVVQVVASGPDVAGDPLYESLLALIFCGPGPNLDRHSVLRARRDAGPRPGPGRAGESTCG